MGQVKVRGCPRPGHPGSSGRDVRGPRRAQPADTSRTKRKRGGDETTVNMKGTRRGTKCGRNVRSEGRSPERASMYSAWLATARVVAYRRRDAGRGRAQTATWVPGKLISRSRSGTGPARKGSG